jgi:tetratricopeptide (TPR) repeat protein
MGSKRKAQAPHVAGVRWMWALALLPIPALVVVIYAGAISAPFAFDDRVHILENPLVTSFEHVFDFSAMARAFNNPSGLAGRPLLMITYGMNYAASRAAPRPFRKVNVLIHTANCFLVFLIVFEIANCIGIRSESRLPLALAAAAVFASHPLMTESVTYVAGRSSALCATFYMAGLYATVRAGRETGWRKWALLFSACLATAIGLLVKQDANALPLACIALVWFVWPAAASARARWTATALLASFTLLSVAVQFRGLIDVSQTTQNNYALVSAGFQSTLPFEPYVLTSVTAYTGYYLWRMLAPAGLSVDPEVATVSTPASPGLLASLAVLITLAFAAVWLKRAGAHKPPLQLVAAGIALVLISPLSAYCVFPLADVVAEHRSYITMLGVAAAVAGILLLTPRAIVISIALTGAYAWLSIERNKVWSDEVLLWEDASRKAPEKIRPHVNLGALYQSRGQADRAMQQYQFVLAREPEHAGALANLAAIHLANNDLGKAEQLLTRAIAQNTSFSAVYLNLGVVRLRQGRFEDARELLERAIMLNPNQLMAHLNLGDVLFNQGEPQKAMAEYLAEIKLNPDFEMAHHHLAVAYEATGMRAQAVAEYGIALKLNPANQQVQAALDRLK